MSWRAGPFDLRLRRLLPAPRERVFAALTRPGDLARWWGPRRFTTPEIELDLRAGGPLPLHHAAARGRPRSTSRASSWRSTRRPGSAYTFRWDEPTPDDRETVVELTVDAFGGGTVLSLWQGEFATGERLALHRHGWTDSLDKLSVLLAARL